MNLKVASGNGIKCHRKYIFQARIRSNSSNEFEMKCIEVVDSDGQKWNEAGSQFQQRQEINSGWYELRKNYYPTCA